jgi:transposase
LSRSCRSEKQQKYLPAVKAEFKNLSSNKKSRGIYSLPKPRGKPRFSHLNNASKELREIVAAHPDATRVELCELFAQKTGNWVGRTAMCSALQKLELNRKKKQLVVAKQAQKKS